MHNLNKNVINIDSLSDLAINGCLHVNFNFKLCNKLLAHILEEARDSSRLHFRNIDVLKMYVTERKCLYTAFFLHLHLVFL